MWMMLSFLLNSLLNFAVSLLVAKFLGPEEYGRYGVALSLAVVVQTLLFDWLRLSATRFYGQRDHEQHPEVRATLDTSFALVAALVLCAAAIIWRFDVVRSLAPGLAALAIVYAAACALSEYAAALLRARFLDRGYAFLVLSKNALYFLLAVGGAALFHSAPVVLVGMMAAMAVSLLLSGRELIAPGAAPGKAQASLALRYFVYGTPIVLANVLYQTVPLTDRWMVSNALGFAEAGQMSLAFEVGIRIVGALGSALDVILFQLAVLAEKTDGEDRARAQVSRNMGIVAAIALPAVAGVYAILPSFEALLAPHDFQGPFGRYFTLQIPALLAFALINYALNPAFQIAHRLAPLIIAALAACVANFLAILFLAPSTDATKFALAQSISSMTGFVVLMALLLGSTKVRPRIVDIVGALVGCAALLVATAPLRAMAPGLVVMLAQIVVGAGAYAAIAYAFDVADLRSAVVPALRRRLQRR